MSCPWVEAATLGWVGKGCSLNLRQKESAILRFKLVVRISSGLLKACLMSVEVEGRWAKQLERQVHPSLGGKSLEGEGSKQVESRNVGRGGLGVTGTWSHHSGYSAAPQSFVFLVTNVEN